MSTTEKLQVICLFLLVIIAFFVLRMHAIYNAVDAKLSTAEESKPDLMEVAVANIAMRKMQLQLRELMVYGEPNEMHELMREYMRLRDEQDEKETQ